MSKAAPGWSATLRLAALLVPVGTLMLGYGWWDVTQAVGAVSRADPTVSYTVFGPWLIVAGVAMLAIVALDALRVARSRAVVGWYRTGISACLAAIAIGLFFIPPVTGWIASARLSQAGYAACATRGALPTQPRIWTSAPAACPGSP